MDIDTTRNLDQLRALCDDDIVAGLDQLDKSATAISAAIVARLVIVKERSIHLARGYSSIVDYCVQWMGCSRDMAYKRSAAVKVAEAYPPVIDSLAGGETSMSAVAVLAPHRDDVELVRDAMGRSRREIERLIAARKGDPGSNRFQRVRPVTDGMSRLELHVPDALIELLDEALDLDSHIDPGRDMAALLSRAVGAYVKQRKKDKFAVVDHPRPEPEAQTVGVPAATLRQAYERSGGHCEYVADDGTRCESRAFLEADHETPRALGGGHETIRILCRHHNQLEAERKLGKDIMDGARRRAQLTSDVGAALAGLGFAAPVARRAATEAINSLGPDTQLEAAIREALRRAPKPRGDARPTERTTTRASEPAPPWGLRCRKRPSSLSSDSGTSSRRSTREHQTRSRLTERRAN